MKCSAIPFFSCNLSGHIPTKPTYGVFISQVIRYARICSKTDDLIERVKSLTKNYYRNTTPSVVSSHHWTNIWRNIAGSLPYLAQDFSGTSQKNNDQHSRNFGPSYLLLIILLLLGNLGMFLPITQSSTCTIGWSDPGPCITNVFATCRKNFSQWHRSFQRKLRSHWLKFLRHVATMLVIQGPGCWVADTP